MKIEQLKRELRKIADPKRAEASKKYFKTGIGQYSYGDVFLGVTVPAQRKLAYKYMELELPVIKELLKSPVHEYRFVALKILVAKYERGNFAVKKDIFNFYLENKKRINNWDLVDTSAGYILGDYLFDKNKDALFELTGSKNVWEKRMAIIATFNFIKKNRYNETIKIAELLFKDNHDLIHKAVGWMLREVGKRSIGTELEFLDKHYKKMLRVMLRYAIEKFTKEKRQYYLNKK